MLYSLKSSRLFVCVIVLCTFAMLRGFGSDPVRSATQAYLRGDFAIADELFASAETSSDDPGFVAFNRAAILFQQKDYQAAELHYAQVLDDRECPPVRAARAWFNRGTCLMFRGNDAGTFRQAIACFERCLDLSPNEPLLVSDARHNLELAKVRWIEFNQKTAKPDTPNQPPPEEMHSAPQPNRTEGQETGQIDPTDGGNRPVAAKASPSSAKKESPANGPQQEGNATTAGNNQAIPVLLLDGDLPQQLTLEETRGLLKRVEERLRRERQSLNRSLSGPDRPGFPDW